MGAVEKEKEFAYLVQGRAHELAKFQHLQRKESDLFVLSFDEPPGINAVIAIFDPNCTWAEGRNLLLASCKDYETYRYYVFLDGDVDFLSGTFEDFENLLLEQQPYLGVPLADVIEGSGRWCPALAVQQPVGFDEVMLAYSNEAIQDQILIPLVTKFDSLSWWYSCVVEQNLVFALFAERVAQFNSIRVKNTRHTLDEESPQEDSGYIGGVNEGQLEHVNHWIAEEIFRLSSVHKKFANSGIAASEQDYFCGHRWSTEFQSACSSFAQAKFRATLKHLRNSIVSSTRQFFRTVSGVGQQTNLCIGYQKPEKMENLKS
jgi:hypothetical protein